MDKLNKNVQILILVVIFGVAMLLVTFSYAAFSTELTITGGALINVERRDTISEYVESQLSTNLDVKRIGNAVRYVGNDPHNYVYFNGELWRILGTFNVQTENGSKTLTKLIRPEPVEIMSWNSDWYTNNKNGKNDFTSSVIYNYLYNNFYYKSYDQWNTFTCYNGASMSSFTCSYKGLNLNSASMVEKVYYNLGSTNPYTLNDQGVMTPAFLLQSENGSATPNACTPHWDDGSRCTENDSRPSSVLTYVGLPYPSDIGYSIGDEACISNTMGNSCYANSWTSAAGPEWSISPSFSRDYGDTVIALYQGQLWSEPASNSFGIRPVLYLKEDVHYSGGTGTAQDPILITYDGPIGIETGLVNYAPEGEPVNTPEETTSTSTTESTTTTTTTEPVEPELINPDVKVNISVNEITGWTGHYNFGFTIENTTDEVMDHWTIEFTFNPNVTVDVSQSYLPNRVTGVLTNTYIKVNNENKYYAPNPYIINVGETYESNNDGLLMLTFDPNVVSLDNIFTNIVVKNVSESFE